MRFTAAFRILAVLLALTAIAVAFGGPGFRTRDMMLQHYAKHGKEFGNISVDQYLRMAQELRDAPKSDGLLEAVREDGVITRFQRKTGYFGAYNPDRTIRTFFIPADGERYFLRQARRPR